MAPQPAAFLRLARDTCESVQGEIAKIGREISQSSENAWDRAEELDALRQKMEDMGCLGPQGQEERHGLARGVGPARGHPPSRDVAERKPRKAPAFPSPRP